LFAERKKDVAAPNLIYLDKGDEQIGQTSREEDEDEDEDEEAEIAQLVDYPGLNVGLDPSLVRSLVHTLIPSQQAVLIPSPVVRSLTPQVERKFPTRRPRKRPRPSTEENEDMDMSDDTGLLLRPLSERALQLLGISQLTAP
jgi:hypothetical protein